MKLSSRVPAVLCGAELFTQKEVGKTKTRSPYTATVYYCAAHRQLTMGAPRCPTRAGLGGSFSSTHGEKSWMRSGQRNTASDTRAQASMMRTLDAGVRQTDRQMDGQIAPFSLHFTKASVCAHAQTFRIRFGLWYTAQGYSTHSCLIVWAGQQTVYRLAGTCRPGYLWCSTSQWV